MKVSVIMSSYNQKGSLELALEALRLQDEKPLEVIVADDGSSDGTLEWLDGRRDEGWPFDLRYVTRRHSWYRLASINNLAASKAMAGRILFTNADQVHCPSSVGAHAMLPGDVVGAGIFKGIDVVHSGAVDLAMVRDFESVVEWAEDHPSEKTNVGYIGRVDPTRNPIGVWGGNFSVPVEAFRKIGGYDKAFDVGWGGEENDLVARCVKKAGCRVGWVIGSVIYHLDHQVRPYARTRLGSSLYARRGI
jgi:glycosyltransferase involved in cell wall biosynthesis